jgi:hypothetical protein
MLKIEIFSLFVLLALTLLGVKCQNPAPTQAYTNNMTLQSPDLYYLYWSYNSQNITFEVHVKNSAWLLFGLQGSTYSDVVVAAVFADGTGHYSERILNKNTNDLTTLTGNPIVNWYLLDAFNSNNYTVLKFWRNIKVQQCGQQSANIQSLDINTDLNTLVFASGSYFNTTDNSIMIGNSLGSSQVNLLPTISSLHYYYYYIVVVSVELCNSACSASVQLSANWLLFQLC